MSRHAPQHEQSTNNNTVPAAPAWRRTLRRVLLLVFLFTLSTVWLTQICGCRGRLMDPEEPLKGTTVYALMRVLQPRFMRLPKPQVKIGGRPKAPKN